MLILIVSSAIKGTVAPVFFSGFRLTQIDF
jgi:hypothetical protein